MEHSAHCTHTHTHTQTFMGRQWVTLSFHNTKVSHQTLNPTAELWCKTLSRIKVDLVLHRT